MNWSDINIFAVDNIIGNRGIGIRTPILINNRNVVFIPNNIKDEICTPKIILEENEYTDLINRKFWFQLEKLKAIKNHLVILRSQMFTHACKLITFEDNLNWISCEDISFTYIDFNLISNWKKNCAKFFIDWAEKNSNSEYLTTVIEQSLFVTDIGSIEREKIFELFKYVL